MRIQSQYTVKWEMVYKRVFIQTDSNFKKTFLFVNLYINIRIKYNKILNIIFVALEVIFIFSLSDFLFVSPQNYVVHMHYFKWEETLFLHQLSASGAIACPLSSGLLLPPAQLPTQSVFSFLSCRNSCIKKSSRVFLLEKEKRTYSQQSTVENIVPADCKILNIKF